MIAKPVLAAASDAFDKLEFGILVGAFVTVLILLVIPVILLGTASPFAIRLSIQRAHAAGQVSGRIYSISTLGIIHRYFSAGADFNPDDRHRANLPGIKRHFTGVLPCSGCGGRSRPRRFWFTCGRL